MDEAEPTKAADAVDSENEETRTIPDSSDTSAAEFAWSAAAEEQETETTGETRSRALWLGPVMALLAAAIAVASVLMFYVQRAPAPKAPAPTTSSATARPASSSPISPPPQTSTTPPTTTASATPTQTLPLAIVGSFCRPDSTPTHDPDGATVYCAIVPEVPMTAVWSRMPGPLPYPKISGERVTEAEGPWWVVVCEQQTGRTFNYCKSAIDQATYQGDGPIPGA